MLPSILIRLGGLAAMVSGALYVSADLLNLPGGGALWRSYYGFLPGGGSLFFNALLEQFSNRMVPLVETRRVLNLLY